ncbi:diethylphosphate phosphodiesterase [Tistlia consotensis]|uniref:Diethylphosphate phosphodiesterase n=1 Tax=Tistlia consotensis USBA 355 TaxID=560819 RepID=A0A1Y6CUS1_9PROT|nr:phosphodiesterase [Tistlia consotensis]SMF78485.1 diethylphosphate phosphodiesterase [Tistlia consotensis USBA 355]SNS18630.1 diethylphosphate phosphodiesterase [Tistlia consotensis]
MTAFKFIHVTDTHLIAPPHRLYGLDPRERLAAAVADIARLHGDAAFVAITGDLTHRGEPGAYAALREVLAGLPMPCHLVLGNHDDRAAFLATFPETPTDDGGFVQYAVETPAGVMVMLDSLTEGTHGGLLCEERLDWLAGTVERHRERDLFLFLHHAPFDVGVPGMDRIRLMNAEAFWQALGGHSRIRHLFYGHVHRPICGSWRGIPCSTLPGTSHQVQLQFVEPTAVPGSYEPPAYGIVLASDDAVVVHNHAFLDDSLKFPLDSAEAEAAQSAEALRELTLVPA